SNGEEIVSAVILKHEQELTEQQSVVFVTEEGMIKRTALSEYQTFRGYRRRKSMAIKLKTETDRVKSVHIIDTSSIDKEVMIITQVGFSLRYLLEEVPQT